MFHLRQSAANIFAGGFIARIGAKYPAPVSNRLSPAKLDGRDGEQI